MAGEANQHRQSDGHYKTVDKMIEQTDRQPQYHLGSLPQPKVEVQEIERKECEEDQGSLQVTIPSLDPLVVSSSRRASSKRSTERRNTLPISRSTSCPRQSGWAFKNSPKLNPGL